MHIVLIPGLMNDGWVWRHQLGPLSRLGPVTIARNDGCETLGGMAERLLDATAGPLCLVGHSMGGRVALEAVARARDRIARLVLLDTGAAGATDAEAEGRLALAALALDEGMAAVAARWLPPMLGAKARGDMGLVAGITAMLMRCAPEDFGAQQRALLSRPDRSALLGEVACPTLLAAGSEDAWSPPEAHRAMAANMPDARAEEIGGSGHMVPVEAPEQLTRLLLDFLGEYAGAERH